MSIGMCSIATQAFAASLVVHEWGTFTSFQDAEGRTIAGINVDDEPVPSFVHRLKDLPIFTTRSLPSLWSQGAPSCHTDVTLRLETPVLYFYPSSAFAQQSFDVQAKFTGGWLTEFFPMAKSDAPGFPNELRATTQGSLNWSGLRLSSNEQQWMPTTNERVWLTPRNVRASLVTDTAHQEAEKYVFYRGVGHIDAPLVTRKRGSALEIQVREGQSGFEHLPTLWLVDVGPDARVTYTSIRNDRSSKLATALPVASSGTLDQLRRELMTALTAEGLYPDEAQAMLDTWQLSYFQSEGRRLFFIVPRAWTDAHLPLSISASADITRVMVGRIELVSPHQRATLDRLLQLPDSAFPKRPLYYEDNAVLERMRSGNASHSDLYRAVNREVPESLSLYESLGRFRDALLAHELSSTQDDAKRERLERIMQVFSACLAPP
jgi:hypothetical protein